jgi:hypothetical protein
MPCLAGCEKPPTNLLVVEGTVKLDGHPVEMATISLIPERGLPASGVTDPQGHFKALTVGKRGCEPGTYRVAVIKTKNTEDGPAPNMLPTENTTKGSVQNLLPKKYATPQSSGLAVVVAPDMTPVEIKLKSSP